MKAQLLFYRQVVPVSADRFPPTGPDAARVAADEAWVSETDEQPRTIN